MYHFTADYPPEPIRLSFRALIPGHIRQYLKDFQLNAIRFMHNFLTKDEFCIYNDESGLGKQAAVVVLLDAACSSRKCLIVVQNDDRYLDGWEFHFNVLTKTNVTVIKDEKDATESPHSIYIAKWSTLRTIEDLSKFKFDVIILDNRGQMLNNSFCTSMLLKHYERKINILISSVDITSDLKLLHNALRLGGRLEPQYSNFKVFEEKFKLPDAKELAYKRIDLEEYFCKRERLADYCRAFRIRHYCHQFETQLPLVKEDRYKINVELWREKQNATNSESSSVEYVKHQNHDNDHIKDTQELFEEYCRQRRKQHLQFQQEEEQRLQQRERDMLKNLDHQEIIYNVDDEVAVINDSPKITTENIPIVGENSDEPILMSPLLVESDSDPDGYPELCNDPITDIEIVDLSSEENKQETYKENENENENHHTDNVNNMHVENILDKVPKKKILKKRSELDRLEEDIVDALKLKEVHKRQLRHNKEKDNAKTKNKTVMNTLQEKSKNTRNTSDKTPKIFKNVRSVKLGRKRKYGPNEKDKQTRQPKHYKSAIDKQKGLVKKNVSTPENIDFNRKNSMSGSSSTNTGRKKLKTLKKQMFQKKSSKATVSFSSKVKKSVQTVKNICNEAAVNAIDSPITIKQELGEETSHAKKANSKDFQVKIKKLRLKREQEISSPGICLKQTRSMTRKTRSGIKYLTKTLSVKVEKLKKFKKKYPLNRTELTESNKCKELVDSKTKDKNKIKNIVEDKTKDSTKSTQISIISHQSSQEYEPFQCAQRLSDVSIFDNGLEKTGDFLMPPTPNSVRKNSLIPSSLTSANFFTQSEVIFISPNNPQTKQTNDQIVSILSSDNEKSTSQTSLTNVSMTSRRTRALKPRRNQKRYEGETNKMSCFADLLPHQNKRSSTKSPDLFSNCSDLIQVPCTQPNLNSEESNAPFEGFKIFGSEVKQLQQHYASKKNNNINKNNPKLKNTCREQRSCLDILEKMFDPSNKKLKQINNENSNTSAKKPNRTLTTTNKYKTCTNILPSHPIEAITEVCQQQELQKRKGSTMASSSALQDDEIFEITNNGTFGSVMRLHSNGEISPVQYTQKTNTKQHNKITNYLIGNATHQGSLEEIIHNSGSSSGNINTEIGTPSKKHQQAQAATQNINAKKSPKSKYNTTQTTKLTKWFTKPGETRSLPGTAKQKFSNSKKTFSNQVQGNDEIDLTKANSLSQRPAGKRILKRRRLDLSFK